MVGTELLLVLWRHPEDYKILEEQYAIGRVSAQPLLQIEAAILRLCIVRIQTQGLVLKLDPLGCLPPASGIAGAKVLSKTMNYWGKDIVGTSREVRKEAVMNNYAMNCRMGPDWSILRLRS